MTTTSSSSKILGPTDHKPQREDKAFLHPVVIPTDGYSLVVKAQRDGRWWCLKGVKETYRSQPLYTELLRKEYHILTQLQHLGVVQAYGMEEVEGYGTCIVMEYVDGRRLDELLQEKTDRSQRKRLFMLLLDALEYIHAKQVVHRDLKPENILVTHNGSHVKLVDFGLADADSWHILKQPAGTLEYMSPEQKNERVADVRNDIYSLGCIMRQMSMGWYCRPVAKRCMGEARTRYANIAELRAAWQQWRRMAIALATVLVLLLAGTLLLLAWPSRTEQTTDQKQDTVMAIAPRADNTNQTALLQERKAEEAETPSASAPQPLSAEQHCAREAVADDDKTATDNTQAEREALAEAEQRLQQQYGSVDFASYPTPNDFAFWYAQVESKGHAFLKEALEKRHLKISKELEEELKTYLHKQFHQPYYHWLNYEKGRDDGETR